MIRCFAPAHMLKGFSTGLIVMTAASVLASFVAEAACGSRGGPGYRKANGKCASHRD